VFIYCSRTVHEQLFVCVRLLFVCKIQSGASCSRTPLFVGLGEQPRPMEEQRADVRRRVAADDAAGATAASGDVPTTILRAKIAILRSYLYVYNIGVWSSPVTNSQLVGSGGVSCNRLQWLATVCNRMQPHATVCNRCNRMQPAGYIYSIYIYTN
jgi:hypothetical protein